MLVINKKKPSNSNFLERAYDKFDFNYDAFFNGEITEKHSYSFLTVNSQSVGKQTSVPDGPIIFSTRIIL